MENLIEQGYADVFEAQLIEEIKNIATVVEFKEGDVLIELGEFIRRMPILLSGAIKIMREDKDEGELLLYFLEAGDTCAMTLAY